MRYAVLILIVIGTSLGCGKENQDPVFNNFSLVGYWLSSDGKYIFDIKDIHGGGENEKYQEYYQGSGRYIKRTFNGLVTVYQILKITPYELHISPQHSNGSIEFSRIK